MLQLNKQLMNYPIMKFTMQKSRISDSFLHRWHSQISIQHYTKNKINSTFKSILVLQVE